MSNIKEYSPLPSVANLFIQPMFFLEEECSEGNLLALVAGMVASPLAVVIGKPLACVIDLVIGVVEPFFALYKGASTKEAANIFVHRWTSFPAQHLLDMTIQALAVVILGPLALIITGYLAPSLMLELCGKSTFSIYSASQGVLSHKENRDNEVQGENAGVAPNACPYVEWLQEFREA